MDLQIHNLISRTNFPNCYIIFSTFTCMLGKHNCISGLSLSIFYITINGILKKIPSSSIKKIENGFADQC